MEEINPMLGFRGVRLSLVYPEISEVQVRAIFQASLLLKKAGKDPQPHIEVPLVGNLQEFLYTKDLVDKVARETGAHGVIPYKIGTMIE